ncbi:MAG: protein kinase [Vulcanimicrobiota bacterium]
MNFESAHDGRSSLVRCPVHVAEDPELRRTYREISSRLCQIQHPHIVKIQEVLDDDWLMVEGLHGAVRLTSPPDNPGELLRSLLEAIEYAHWRGLTHRLLTCNSLWLFPGTTLKVWGFGLDYLEQLHGPAQRFEVTPSAPYWSPEHCLHQEPDERSDIWALGVILYRWFTGRLPFQSNCMPVLVDQILHFHPPDPRGPYADLILRCLEKKQIDRFQSVAEVNRYL